MVRDADGTRLAAMPYFFVDRYLPAYIRQWEAFAEAVRSGRVPPVTGEDARAPLVIGLAALALVPRAASGPHRRGGRMSLFADQRLDDRVVIVTGSTQGLGQAIAVRAAELGAAGIVVCGREPGARRAGPAAARPSSAPRRCSCRPTSPSEQDCRSIVRACEERFGRLDGLVNSAGLTSRGTLDDTSVELWDRMFAVNVRAPFLLMQEAARVMRRNGTAAAW